MNNTKETFGLDYHYKAVNIRTASNRATRRSNRQQEERKIVEQSMKGAMQGEERVRIDSEIEDDSFSSDYSNEVGSDGDSSEFSSGKAGKCDGAKLAQTETKFVLCSKFMAYLVLFLSALGSGIFAFYFTRNEEREDFKYNVGANCNHFASGRSL